MTGLRSALGAGEISAVRIASLYLLRLHLSSAPYLHLHIAFAISRVTCGCTKVSLRGAKSSAEKAHQSSASWEKEVRLA